MENGYTKTDKQKLKAAFTILAILISGFLIFSYLMHHKKKIKRVKPHTITIYVNTQKVQTVNTNYQIPAYGRIKPSKQITLFPQVSGKIIYINPSFYEGSFVKKHDLLVKIDDADYKLKVKIQQAKLESLEEDLKIQIGKKKAAKIELYYAKKFIKNLSRQSQYLLLQKPYTKKIIDSINIAKSELENAKLNLERTAIKAPFDAYILNKYIDKGSTVSPSSKIADLVYAKEFYIEALINYNDIKYINLDNTTKAQFETANQKTYAAFKSISRSTDQDGIMAKLIFSFTPTKDITKYIILNNYVSVTIMGKKLDNICKIPINALRDNNTVWLYKNSKLHIKKIDVTFKSKKYAYTYDLGKNDEIVTSNIALPIEGIKLKKIDKNEQ